MRETFSAREPRNPGIRGVLVWGAGIACLCWSSACEIGLPAGAEPHRELNFLDMADQPKLKPQRPDMLGQTPNGMIPPPAGALATDEVPYPFTQEQEELAGVLVNPLPATPANVERGKWVFEHVCVTCHGPEAAGDGHLTKLFPKPPSLMTQRVRDWPDGRIFHRPMRGQGSMPSQISVIEADEAWAAVLYVRSLQQRLPVAPPPESGAAPTPTDAGSTDTDPTDSGSTDTTPTDSGSTDTTPTDSTDAGATGSAPAEADTEGGQP